MKLLAANMSDSLSSSPLRKAFLKWQCRVRQMAMRDAAGRPDEGIMPTIILPGSDAPLGQVITILNKTPAHSVTPELNHMIAKTNDPAQRREQAIRFLSASYYQRASEFSDVLTATFQPGSAGAAEMRRAGKFTLLFAAYAQRFELACEVSELRPGEALYQATMAHNKLFNPALSPATEVLGFVPDWSRSSSEPAYA